MLKQLLFATCIISTTYGADDRYIDPDFALLEGVHVCLSVEGDKVFSQKGESFEECISRLNSGDEEILQSRDPAVLGDAITTYTLNTKYHTARLHTALWADISHTCSTPEVFADFLRQIFWNRFTLLSKIVNTLLALPHDQIESELLLFSLHKKNGLDGFSKKYDASDITPFKKGQAKLFEAFLDEFSQIISKRN